MSLDELLSRHRAFWTRRSTTPLVTARPLRQWTARPYPLHGGDAVDCRTVAAEEIDVARLVGLGTPLPAAVRGEMLEGMGPLYPTAWLEALAGCPIVVSPYGCVTRPVGTLAEILDRFDPDAGLASPWFPLMRRTRAACIRRAHGTRAVRGLHFRGVVDLLAALLGEDRLCLAACDDPVALRELAERAATLVLRAAAWDAESRPLWHGGSVGSWGLFAPGRHLEYQLDASSLFAPAQYAELFAESDRLVLRAHPVNLVHLHSVGVHLLDVMLVMPEATAIELSLDREAVLWDQKAMLRACRRIQAAGKPLLLVGELSPEELRRFLDALDPAGLAIDCWHESA